MPKIKNILIFLAVGGILVSVYLFYLKSSPDNTPTLVSSSGAPAVSSGVPAGSAGDTEAIARDFINLLLSVKSIRLDVSIFSDPAFISLEDSSIVLVPDGNEGRPNPFAPIGVDIGELPSNSANALSGLNDAMESEDETEAGTESGSGAGTSNEPGPGAGVSSQ